MLRDYYRLTKPGIIRGNIIVATAGFLFASKQNIDYLLLIYMLVGMSLIIASGCVFNNLIDINLDKVMSRTNKRPLVTGAITIKNAIVFGSIIGVLGFTILTLFTNYITALIGIIGFLSYVVLYSIFKRRSSYGTLIGSISGATPPIAGYCAVTGNFDAVAVLLFLILVAWQMPHFYAIAIYRSKDYKAAKIPVLPAVTSIKNAKIHMIAYIVALIFLTSLLTILGYSGMIFLIVMAITGLVWLRLAIEGLSAINNTMWAKKLFRFSLVVITILSLMLSVDSFLQ